MMKQLLLDLLNIRRVNRVTYFIPDYDNVASNFYNKAQVLRWTITVTPVDEDN